MALKFLQNNINVPLSNLSDGYSYFNNEIEKIKKLPITDIGDVNGLSWIHYNVVNDLNLSFFFNFDFTLKIEPKINKILIQDIEGNLLLFEVNTLPSAKIFNIYNIELTGDIIFSFVGNKYPVFKQQKVSFSFKLSLATKNIIVDSLTDLYTFVSKVALRAKILDEFIAEIDSKKNINWITKNISFPGFIIKPKVDWGMQGPVLSFYNKETKNCLISLYIDFSEFLTVDKINIFVNDIYSEVYKGNTLFRVYSSDIRAGGMTYISYELGAVVNTYKFGIKSLFNDLIPELKKYMLDNNIVSFEKILENSYIEERNW